MSLVAIRLATTTTTGRPATSRAAASAGTAARRTAIDPARWGPRPVESRTPPRNRVGSHRLRVGDERYRLRWRSVRESGNAADRLKSQAPAVATMIGTPAARPTNAPSKEAANSMPCRIAGRSRRTTFQRPMRSRQAPAGLIRNGNRSTAAAAPIGVDPDTAARSRGAAPCPTPGSRPHVESPGSSRVRAPPVASSVPPTSSVRSGTSRRAGVSGT